MQVPTLRNVDKRPYPTFVKPRCKPGDAGEGTTCWPAPESTDNMNASKVGHLGLSDAEEDALVAFMQTLTDGFMPVDR
jgi:hypothetical protein